MDTWAINTYNYNPVIYAIVSEWVGLFSAFIIVLLLAKLKVTSAVGHKRPLGALIDPEFVGLVWPGREYKQAFRYVAIGGVFGGVNTLFYFLAADLVDPSIIQPLFQVVTLYFLVIEVIFVEKEWPTIIEAMAVMNIVAGGILLTISGNFSGDVVVGALFILGPVNITQVFITFYQKKARQVKTPSGRRMDSLNIRLWLLAVMSVTTMIFGLPLFPKTIVKDTMANLYTMVPISVVGMTVAFVAYVLYIRALAMGKMSIVNAVYSVSVVFSVIFTFVLGSVAPGTFGSFTNDQFLWVIKVFGTILVVAGIVVLSISEVQTYIFLTVRVGFVPGVMNQLSNLKVNKIALASGKFDIIVYLRSRSIGRVHSLLIKKIEQIPGIESMYTMAIMKRWERY